MLAGGCVVLAACADYGAVRAHAPSLDDARESRCSVVKDHSRPLIVEWPASARGDLEVRMRKGLVAVRYVGCAMEVLDRCTVGGAYRYVPFTPKEDRLVIRDSDELFANLPMGAAGLEAKLKNFGEIDLGMTLVGKYEADGATAHQEDLHGDCGEATHVVTAMTVGAFALSAGGALDFGAGATAFGAGARVNAKDERETLSRDGDRRMCAKATLEDTTPPRWCGAVVRVEVVPVARTAPAERYADVPRSEPVRAAPRPDVSVTPAAVPELRARVTTKTRPAPCDGSSISDCVARCTAGSGPSCLTLAHRAGSKDATYWNLYACLGGSAEGCTGVGMAYARGEFGAPDGLAAQKWYDIAATTK